MVSTVSEMYFKYDKSDYAQSLRALYGNDGYDKYIAKMNSIMENPLKKSHDKYTAEKELQYKAALANAKQAQAKWSQFKNKYASNLSIMRQNNNGYSLTSTQRQNALQASGSGAINAYANFNDAQSEVDYALSLYNEATHSGINFMG